MNVHYFRPGGAWLNYVDRWYLIEARNGRLTDPDLGTAIYLIDEVESGLGMQTAATELTDASFEFRVRRVSFGATHRDASLDCDILLDENESDEAERTVSDLIRQLLDDLKQRDERLESLEFNLTTHRTDIFAGAQDGPSLEGDRWFDRFLNPPDDRGA